jgi:hypothetical protein
MDVWIDGWLIGWMDERMDRWMVGYMDECVDGWMDVGWVDEWCDSPLHRLLALVSKHELHLREYDGVVFRG